MKNIKQSLQDYTANPSINNRLEQQKAVFVWSRVVGDEINKRTKAMHVRNNTLFVAAKSSPWINELQTHKHNLINRINKEIKEKIKDIYIYLDDMIDFEESKREIIKEYNESEIEDIGREIGQEIDDEKIKEKFIEAYKRHRLSKIRGVSR